jgi:hypothetical protein
VVTGRRRVRVQSKGPATTREATSTAETVWLRAVAENGHIYAINLANVLWADYQLGEDGRPSRLVVVCTSAPNGVGSVALSGQTADDAATTLGVVPAGGRSAVTLVKLAPSGEITAS